MKIALINTVVFSLVFAIMPNILASSFLIYPPLWTTVGVVRRDLGLISYLLDLWTLLWRFVGETTALDLAICVNPIETHIYHHHPGPQSLGSSLRSGKRNPNPKSRPHCNFFKSNSFHNGKRKEEMWRKMPNGWDGWQGREPTQMAKIIHEEKCIERTRTTMSTKLKENKNGFLGLKVRKEREAYRYTHTPLQISFVG